MKKIQVYKSESKYILFRIDVYFKDILTEILFLKKKTRSTSKKNLVINLLELIQVMQKMVMI